MNMDIWRYPLRKWQQEATTMCFDKHAKGYDRFLAVATPGAGKTTFALRIVHRFLQMGNAKRVLIVVPTEHLKVQWAKAADKCGIKLDPFVTNERGKENSDFHGMVITYAQLGMAPEVHAQFILNTLVILDECHHAGDNLTWGKAVNDAFDNAVFKLLLSGTPFRTDSNPIPFVEYEKGVSKSDYVYNYTQAIIDNVCREVYFPAYDGKMQWSINETKYTHTFLDNLEKDQVSKRLRTALDPKGDWLKQLMYDANKKLDEIRSTEHRNAGGLILCMNQKHAKECAKILRSVTGETAIMALSDDTDASDKIKDYSNSTNKWIIAVKMVSEGVDIPRLRVGLYATNVKSELFFRQAIGRFVRVIAELDKQNAFIYIPKDEDIVKFAREVEKERNHALEQIPADNLFDFGGGEEDQEQKKGKFIPLSSRATEKQTLKLSINSRIMKMFHVDSATSDEILTSSSLPALAESNNSVVNDKAYYETKNKLREEANTLSKLVAKKTQGHLPRIDWDKPYKDYIKAGGKRIGLETNEELNNRIKWLNSQL